MALHPMVFVDVDTQADFMLPGGRLYVPGAEKLIPTLVRLRDFAERNRIPVLASTDAHPTDSREFEQWPPHCVIGTPGQLKLPETLLKQYRIVPLERETLLTNEELERYRQVILEKDSLDMFATPHADDLVKRLEAAQYVVYGVATEFCVRWAVNGLLERKCPVTLLVDAIEGINPEDEQRVLWELKESGAKLAESKEILQTAVTA